ncbi:MAG TPA: glycine cleavage system protein GcvH [Myxococcaceae bacterium]|jgi:glycine cleavage system H protein
MGEIPKDLKYTKDHEWARKAGAVVVVGVTAHAQEALGDVVYVELPKLGAPVVGGKQFGVIESTKAVSELFAPVSGRIVKVNDSLEDAPQTVNLDPYGAGWLVEVEPADPKAFDSLLSAQDYEKLIKDA